MIQAMLNESQSAGGGGPAPAATGKHVKIKGTQIKQVKGGGFVRVVTADGKEFPITATKAVYKYLRSIGEEVQKNSGGRKVMKKQKELSPEEKEARRQKGQERQQALIEKEGR